MNTIVKKSFSYTGKGLWYGIKGAGKGVLFVIKLALPKKKEKPKKLTGYDFAKKLLPIVDKDRDELLKRKADLTSSIIEAREKIRLGEDELRVILHVLKLRDNPVEPDASKGNGNNNQKKQNNQNQQNNRQNNGGGNASPVPA